MTPSLTGQTLSNKYRIEAPLGEGGFAAVYLATDTDLERRVAVKVLDERLARSDEFIRLFRQEAQATFSLRHPNVVEVYDFQGDGGTYFMVMEFVDGPSLRQVLQRQGGFQLHDPAFAQHPERAEQANDESTSLHEQEGDEGTRLRQATQRYQPLSPGMVVKIGCDLCAALEYAHAQGVIHRDLKPDNVLIAPPGTAPDGTPIPSIAKLGDFGIARVQGDSRLTRTGLRIGTLAYMSPEQIRAAKDLDGRSDLYSLGILLYELLTGTVPFLGSELELIQMHQGAAPLPLSDLRPGLPPALEQVVLRLLAKNPAERYTSAADTRRALLAAANPTPISELANQKSTPSGEISHQPRIELACPACSAALEDPSFVGMLPFQGAVRRDPAAPCPLCGSGASEAHRRAHAGYMHAEAEKFVAGFNFRPGLPMEVRAYEYERAMRPELEKQQAAALRHWREVLSAGGVVPPITMPADPSAMQSVESALRGLNSLAALWVSPAVEHYTVSLQAKRAARAHAAVLHARCLSMAGLLSTLAGCFEKKTSGMQEAYQRARNLWRRAADAWREEDAALSAAARLSVRAADAILEYPQDWEGAGREMRSIAAELQGLSAPWARPDAERLLAQSRLFEQLEIFIGEMDLLTRQVEEKGNSLIREAHETGVQAKMHREVAAQYYELEKKLRELDAALKAADARRMQKFMELDDLRKVAFARAGLGQKAPDKTSERLFLAMQAAVFHQPLPDELNQQSRLAVLVQVIDQARTEMERQLAQPAPPQPLPSLQRASGPHSSGVKFKKTSDVSMVGGWAIPQRGPSGIFDSNATLSASITIAHAAGRDAAQVLETCKNQLLRQKYRVQREAPGYLETQRGDAQAPAPSGAGNSIAAVPTLIQVRVVSTGAEQAGFVVQLQGRANTAGKKLSDLPSLLGLELKDLMEALMEEKAL